MLENCYKVDISDNYEIFEFISEGPRGSVTKVVKYTEINIKGYYNLGFGDKDPLTSQINDLAVTNNEDSQKVLSTVAATIYVFTGLHPDSTIIATGSTQARTRLYQMGISNNLDTVNKDFIVFGLVNEEWEPFRKKVTYDAFLVRRKL